MLAKTARLKIKKAIAGKKDSSKKGIKIAVVGDVILDKYTFGKVERISPEAPIPVLRAEKSSYLPGGAGNVAANLAKLGARVELFGVCGSDRNKKILENELKKFKILPRLITDRNRPTILKERIIASSQQLLRVDYENSSKIGKAVIDSFKRKFNSYDLVVVSDYAKGFITSQLVGFIKGSCRKSKTKIIVDPKPVNKSLYKGCFLLSPNSKECMAMANYYKDDVKAAQLLAKELNVIVLLTRGSKGIAVVDSHGLVKKIATIAKEVVDVTGAGDTVIATFSYFYSQGYSVEKSAELANKAGGIAVSKLGCYQAGLSEII